MTGSQSQNTALAPRLPFLSYGHEHQPLLHTLLKQLLSIPFFCITVHRSRDVKGICPPHCHPSPLTHTHTQSQDPEFPFYPSVLRLVKWRSIPDKQSISLLAQYKLRGVQPHTKTTWSSDELSKIRKKLFPFDSFHGTFKNKVWWTLERKNKWTVKTQEFSSVHNEATLATAVDQRYFK
jgi:hypothetical protein